MKTRWFVALGAAAVAGCSSDIYPLEDVFIEGTSQQSAAEYLYFRVPEGTACAGVRIRSEGSRRILSFVRSAPGVEVDSTAVVSDEHAWEGMLRVEVPIEESVLEDGGEMTIMLDGGGQSVELATFGYPART